MGGQWFNIGKKDETRMNYVEISKEQQAAIDKANKAAQDAKLAEGLSNKQADLDKGLTIQGQHYTEEQLARNGGTLSATPKYKIVMQDVKDFLGVDVLGKYMKSAVKLAGKVLLAPLMVLQSCSPINDPLGPNQLNVSLSITNKELADWIVGKFSDPDFCEEYDIEKETEDGIGYEFGYDSTPGSDAVKPYIMVGDGIKLYIDPKKPLTDQNVFDYITQIGDDLKTKDGIGYHFNMVDGRPQVVLDNGFTHMYGENTKIDQNAPLGTLYEMFDKVGLDDRKNKSGELLTNIDALQNSYGNDEEGIKFELVPGDIREITEGNPHVKGSLYGFEFDGNLEKLPNGEVVIRGADSKEQLRFAVVGQDELLELGSVMPTGEGVLVTTADGNELLMQKIGTTGFNMGKVDREYGTFTQAYPPSNEKFDTDNALDGDKYFDDKRGNLTDAQDNADADFRKFKEIEGNVSAGADVVIDNPPYRRH